MRFMTCLLLLGATSALYAQRAVVRTSGQYNPDGTASYSVFLASGQEDLENLTISAALPPGARYLESVHSPLDGVYEGVKTDVVYWRVDKLERDTLLGPFVIRVRPDGTTASLPATVQAAVAYQRPSAELVESPAPEGRLTPLADRGSIVVDGRGTLDAQGVNTAVPVGDTGVLVFIPEGATQERVTITFRRVPFEEARLPRTEPETWWCSLFEITSVPQVQFSKALAISVPTRRAVTPGLPVSVFRGADLQSWTPVTASKSGSDRDIGFGQFSGSLTCFTQFGQTVCQSRPAGFGGGFGLGGFGAFGYVEQDNLKSKTTGVQLGSSAIGALASPPSIIAILIGVR